MQHSWLPPSTARTLALLLPGQHSRLLTPPANDGGLTHQQGKKNPTAGPSHQTLLILWGRKRASPPPAHSPVWVLPVSSRIAPDLVSAVGKPWRRSPLLLSDCRNAYDVLLFTFQELDSAKALSEHQKSIFLGGKKRGKSSSSVQEKKEATCSI